MTTGLGAGSGSVVTWLWSRRRSKPLRIGVAVLLYLILRTGWSAGGDTGPSAPVTAAPEVGVPALDVTSEVISCGPEMAFGLVQNQTDAPHDYLVEIEIDRGDGDTDVVEREVTTEPRGGALWTVLFDESLPNATCTVSAIHLDG